MRPSTRDDMKGLLRSTWSGLSSLSRRAVAEIGSRYTEQQPALPSQENVYLLPGWAVKRRHQVEAKDRDPQAFDLHVSTSGFAVEIRDLSSASTAQRAVVSLAKRFAALPRLPLPAALDGPGPMTGPEAPSTPDLHSDSGSSEPPPSIGSFFDDPIRLRTAHSNLDARLTPFWSKSIVDRRISLSLYCVKVDLNAHSHHANESAPTNTTKDLGAPLATTEARTDDQGLFNVHVAIPWERLCTHPPALDLAFGEHSLVGRSGWEMVVKAEMAAEVPEENEESSDSDGQKIANTSRSVDRAGPGATPEPVKKSFAQNSITISEPKGVRVISDLDDTIKHSDILAGPREVFRNVFCRPLQDVCVPGMADLYRALSSEGVDGFHMISNSPFELYSSIREFMSIHRFPRMYSLKLKYYGRRSLLGSLMEPAGDRKRPSIVEVLDAFPESKFILFGDSGEQDLEVYSSVAQSRGDQIAAIFIRDITSGRADAINVFDRSHRSSSPTGSESDFDISTPLERPESAMRPVASRSSSQSSGESISSFAAELQDLSSAQRRVLKRAALWDLRMEKALNDIPSSVKLVFFTDAALVKEQAAGIVQSLRTGDDK